MVAASAADIADGGVTGLNSFPDTVLHPQARTYWQCEAEQGRGYTEA